MRGGECSRGQRYYDGMTATEKSDRPQFTVYGGLAGLIVVATAATALLYSGGDPGNHTHWLRVSIAALIGLGVGFYLGETRRQFILDCAAPLRSPLPAIRRMLGLDRDRLRGILQFLLASLIIATWAYFIVTPDWRLHRIIDRLQSPDAAVSDRAIEELQQWDCDGIVALYKQRDRMLFWLLTRDTSAGAQRLSESCGCSEPNCRTPKPCPH